MEEKVRARGAFTSQSHDIAMVRNLKCWFCIVWDHALHVFSTHMNRSLSHTQTMYILLLRNSTQRTNKNTQKAKHAKKNMPKHPKHPKQSVLPSRPKPNSDVPNPPNGPRVSSFSMLFCIVLECRARIVRWPLFQDASSHSHTHAASKW